MAISHFFIQSSPLPALKEDDRPVATICSATFAAITCDTYRISFNSGKTQPCASRSSDTNPARASAATRKSSSVRVKALATSAPRPTPGKI